MLYYLTSLGKTTCQKQQQGEAHCTRRHEVTKPPTCLHILQDPVLCLPVARYIANLERKSKQSKDGRVLEWYKYINSSKESVRHNYTNGYFIPWDGTHSSEDDLSLLLTEKMCTNAMLTVMEIGKFWYKSIIKAYTTMGVVPSSRNMGQNSAIKNDDPHMIALHSHLHELAQFGEVCTTRFVDNWVDGRLERITTNNDYGDMYLPAANGYRPMYVRFMHDIGYIVKRSSKGAVTHSKDPTYEGEYIPPLIIQTYVRIWKRDFPC